MIIKTLKTMSARKRN
ncbi:hypothetical protein MJ524_05090 [Escherichia coli]|nr:hypothetical protein MJ524_05090 [Escherichia coli]